MICGTKAGCANTVMGAFLQSVSIGVSSFNFSHDFFFKFPFDDDLKGQ